MQLSEIVITEEPNEEQLQALGAAFRPILDDTGEDVLGAARRIAPLIEAVMDVEVEVRTLVDEATETSKAILLTTLPPYWPYLLGAAILMALSGLLVMDQPQWRHPYILGVGGGMLLMMGHYATRLWQRSRRIKPLQDRFETLEKQIHTRFSDVAARERALEEAGFSLTTDSFAGFRKIWSRLLSDEGAALRKKVTESAASAENCHRAEGEELDSDTRNHE